MTIVTLDSFRDMTAHQERMSRMFEAGSSKRCLVFRAGAPADSCVTNGVMEHSRGSDPIRSPRED